jgi:MarR family 2-MHQ and catechol resistance regulon transcriptional repressor
MGTNYRGEKAAVLALDAYIKLIRAAESVLTRVHRSIACDLTVSQFGVLESLHHLGPMYQQMIGVKLLKSGGNITMVIDNLEKRGLVERHRDKKDRRYINVHLTQQGAALIEELFPRHVKNIVAELSVLPPEDQEALGRICRQLGRGGQ